MNEIGQRQVREALAQAKWRIAETREAFDSAVYWLGRLPRAAWCAVTGRHAWGEWRQSTTILVPPETRRCRRCGGTEYRGDYPSYTIKVEGGSVSPKA